MSEQVDFPLRVTNFFSKFARGEEQGRKDLNFVVLKVGSLSGLTVACGPGEFEDSQSVIRQFSRRLSRSAQLAAAL